MAALNKTAGPAQNSEMAPKERILRAARELFYGRGVKAVSVDEIAAAAQTNKMTVYRHFPQRSDLVKAVFRREVDACADAAPALTAEYAPGEALANWLHRYTEFLATKRGLAAALAQLT